MTNKVLKVLIKILVFVFLCLLLVFVFSKVKKFGYDIFADRPYTSNQSSMKEAEIEIKEGESLSEIAKDLENKGIIKDHFVFELALRSMENVDKIKAGTYTVKSTLKPSEILDILTNKEE